MWHFWTDPERMCEWWGTAEELDARPGGSYVVEMGGGGVMRGEYLELVPYERIVFTFGWENTEGAPDVLAGSTRVEVTLVDDEGDTMMTLRHTGIPSRILSNTATVGPTSCRCSPWPRPAPTRRRDGEDSHAKPTGPPRHRSAEGQEG